jgi:hypothetical protein
MISKEEVPEVDDKEKGEAAGLAAAINVHTFNVHTSFKRNDFV